MSSRSIHVIARSRISFVLRLNNIPLNVYRTFSLISCLSMDIGLFFTLVTENGKAAMNMGSLQDPDFCYFWYITRVGIAGSSGCSAFKQAWIQRREKL